MVDWAMSILMQCQQSAKQMYNEEWTIKNLSKQQQRGKWQIKQFLD
jgi:hypothetical protein